MKATAAIFTGINQPFEVKEFEVQPPESGKVLLELVASGICGTDIHILKGKIPMAPPLIIGHEFIGKVSAISDADSKKFNLKIGDNVTTSIAIPCGDCILCKEGNDANCVNMKVTNGEDPNKAPHFFGGFAEYLYIDCNNAIKIPSDIDPVMACVFPCAGPTSLHAFSLAKKAGLQVNSVRYAVVQGIGPVGLFAVMYLKSQGVSNIIAITAGNNQKREELAIELGATKVLNLERSSDSDIIKEIKTANGGLGADLVFEASGSINALPIGLQLLRNRGFYLVPGQYSNSGTCTISPQLITFNALNIIGSSQYSMTDVKDYIAFLKQNKDLHAKINKLKNTYTVQEINLAFQDAMSGSNIKTMLVK